LLTLFAAASSANLPKDVVQQLPPRYTVLAVGNSSVDPGHSFYIVALARRSELKNYLTTAKQAPARPLLIFEGRPNGHYVLVGRNDDVVARKDDAGVAGNGCDPFEDGHIAVKGAYFTVENAVSCGAHWTNYITFRFDRRVGGFVFDNNRFESWSVNPSNDPNAEALIPDGQKVTRANGRLIVFSKWRDPSVDRR
jgi:hypothetical protein